jgi:cupin 2 domain-containing protein
MDHPKVRSLIHDLPAAAADEITEILARGRGVRIERIVSFGHRSPEGFWYDQEEAEWVAVLAGRGAVQFEGEAEPVELGPGEALLIPARVRHRVAWTAEGEPTVWLAVSYEE